jgi:exonuclease VII large subunit
MKKGLFIEDHAHSLGKLTSSSHLHELSDGYISDVPTYHSAASSEISADLITSTKILENHFKEKYQTLRKAYEQRIKQFSETISNLCNSVYNDELLQQLKNDKTSSLFIPSHLTEIIDHHLSNEREKFLQELQFKNSSLESELTLMKKQLTFIEEEKKKKEDLFISFEKQSKQKILTLKQSYQSKYDECESLKEMLTIKDKEMNSYELSIEENNRSLAIIEGIDKQENLIKK